MKPGACSSQHEEICLRAMETRWAAGYHVPREAGQHEEICLRAMETVVDMQVAEESIRQHEEICLRAMETGILALLVDDFALRQHEEICLRAMETFHRLAG